MNWFQRWVIKTYAKSVTKDLVVQGNHKRRIIQFYRVLYEAAEKEFNEDNKPTLDSFLKECHNDALLNKKRERYVIRNSTFK